MASTSAASTSSAAAAEPAALPSSDPTKTLTIGSFDGVQFVISESTAIQSITIKNLVEDDCANGVLVMNNVDGPTLAKVLEYLKKHNEEGLSADELTEFDTKFLDAADKIQDLFPILLAANYMEIKDLLDITMQKIADRIKDLSHEEVREVFDIENDFTPEEEEKIRQEAPWAFEE